MLSSFEAEGVTWILTQKAIIPHTNKHVLRGRHVQQNVWCVSVKSHHEVWLCEDPPELFGLHVLWVTGEGFQYLGNIKNPHY